MKKLTALLLSLILCLSCFTALAEDEAPLRVTIVVAGTLGDKSFYDSANAGLEQLIEEYGVEGKVVECREDFSLMENALIEAAENSDIVVPVGWQFWDYLVNVVPEMPETKFMFIDNDLIVEGGDNLMSIIYAQNEGSFLVGYLAAKMTKTGKIGAVGGEDNVTINDFLVGYKAGAEYAGLAGENVLIQYAGDFEDPAKGKENALALYDKGCDIVFQVAGKTGMGVFEAAAEAEGRYAIGVDSDQKYINEDIIICSMVKEVGLSIYSAIAEYIEDESTFMGGQIWKADMASGFIGVGYGEEGSKQQISDDLKLEVEELADKIVNGEIAVPTAY
ncbi:MAG: BMP family ABC transporter substrate-binding protein [Clostridia bacterium]|nr:BMP family ABC transporter substrate-binding protein [Clostridia bacterium]